MRLFGSKVTLEFLVEVSGCLKWINLVEGEQWIRAGTVGDHAFYLDHGNLRIMNKQESQAEVRKKI